MGDWDTRVPFPDDPWGGLQENFVGVEEFVQLMQYIGDEPLVCVRWTGKTPQDAANEVEYFNGSAETEWGNKRAKNGHREPYHVKYWEVGNEVGGGGIRRVAEGIRRGHAEGGSLDQDSDFLSQRQHRAAGRQRD